MAQSTLRTSIGVLQNLVRLHVRSRSESTMCAISNYHNHDRQMLRTLSSSSSTTTTSAASTSTSSYNHQYRYQSSARPLPDDELEDHTVLLWDESEELYHLPKRVTTPSTNKLIAVIPSTNSRHDNTIEHSLEVEYTKLDTKPSIAGNDFYHNNNNDSIIHKVEAEVPTTHKNCATKEQLSNIVAANEDDEVLAATISPSSLKYTGDAIIPITSKLHIVKPHEDTPRGIWPVFRLMDENGELRNPEFDGFNGKQTAEHTGLGTPNDETANDDELKPLRSKLSDLFPFQSNEIDSSGLLQCAQFPFADTNSSNTLLRAHRQMVRLRTMDTILQNAQRQGRISFYLTCTGEEAIHMGAGSALNNQDQIFAQYREQGLLMWRGFTLEQFTNQCFSNDRDLGKGRQMPIHYGSRALNYHTVSSPLGTQLPQAVGAAYRLKLMKKPNVAICFFGDGCASTTDFHAALNFAATLSAPVIFFCRNNGYAISTPVTDQYAGDGIVSRAPGYGMAAIRVDGNDIFAVHAAVREAKKYALQYNAPVLIEGMTYRLGHHSTSDDSTKYRSEDEVSDFADTMDPLIRFEIFLKRHDMISDDEITKIKDYERIAVLDAIKMAEKRPKPNIDSMFEDVYKEVPLHLQKQLNELKQHVAKYPDHY